MASPEPKLLAAVPLYYILELLDVNLLRSSGQVWISSAGAIQQAAKSLWAPPANQQAVLCIRQASRFNLSIAATGIKATEQSFPLQVK